MHDGEATTCHPKLFTSLLSCRRSFFCPPRAGLVRVARVTRASSRLFRPLLTAYFGFVYRLVSTTGAFTVTLPWAPNLGLSLSFHFDGLGLLFATLITAIGTLIVRTPPDTWTDTETQGSFTSRCSPSWEPCWELSLLTTS